MDKHKERYVRKVMCLAKQMSVLADQMDAECDDDGCAVISGVIRDCAYKIGTRVERSWQPSPVLGLWYGTAVGRSNGKDQHE